MQKLNELQKKNRALNIPKPEKPKLNPFTNNLLLNELLEFKPNAEDVQALIDKYPDAVREVYEFGRLPLHTALIFRASTEVIRVLLKADPSAAKKDGGILLW
jgi:hypothetical protein